MRKLLATLALTACTQVPIFDSPQPAIGEFEKAYKSADLVVIGTPQEEALDPFLSLRVTIGAQDVVWNVLVSVDSVLKGSVKSAKYVDYGLPSTVTPSLPFRMSKKDIVIQRASRWKTATFQFGTRQVLFLKRCYNCLRVPSRSSRAQAFATPWFVLAAWPLETSF